MTTLKRGLGLAASVAALAFAAQAAAQPTTTEPSPEKSAPGAQIGAGGPGSTGPSAGPAGVQEVVVTAQRRSENVQRVPIAITAFSPRQLEAAQIKDTTDLARFTPSVTGGLNTGTGSALTFFIRGLGSTEQIATFDVPVATYVDEIYFARQSANAVSLFDIDRVEVLRGPQGTLFGRNTTGGAVSITTRKPAKTFGYFVEGSYGSYNRGQVRGSVDMPVNDKILTKLSAFYVSDDGYGHNSTTGERIDGEDAFGVRGAVRLLPTDRLTWDISLDYIDQAKTTLGSAPFDPDYNSRSGLRFTTCDNHIINTYLASSLGNCARVQTGGLTSNLAYRFDWATLNVISGYRLIDQNFAIDFFNGTSPRGGYVIANQVRNAQYTQEFKLVGDLLGSRLRYVAGAFFLHEQSKTAEIDYGVGFGLGLLSDWILHNTTDSVAVYAQGDYKVTDDLTLTVGGRVTSEGKSLRYIDAVKAAYPAGVRVTVPAAGSRLSTANVIAAGIPTGQDTLKFTPRVALSWQIDPNKLIYASATNGFKSGGWNTRVTNIVGVTIFGPETAWSYELGARTQWLDNTLRVNATLYHEDVSDLQLLSGSGNGQFVTRNAGDLHATGLEFDVTWSPIRNFDLFVTGSAAKREYDNLPRAFGAGGVPCSNSPEPLNCTTVNDEPVRFPDNQLSAGLTYRWPLPSLAGTLSFNGAVTYSGRYWTSTYNDAPLATGIPVGGTIPVVEALAHVPQTAVLNIGMTFKSEHGWEAALECANCNGEYYPTSSLFGLGYYNDPRRVTARLRYAF